MLHHKNRSSSKGFVMIVVLILIIFFAAVAQRFSRQMLIAQAFAKTSIDSTQAQLLAYSGLSIALTNLFRAENLLDLEKKTESDQPEKKLKNFYKVLLPQHNLWQQYPLEEPIDGVSGTIKFCISAEDGKININKIFDSEKKQLLDDYKKLLSKFEVQKNSKDRINLAEFLEEFFNNRDWRIIEDASTLDFGSNFKIFYTPPALSDIEKKLESEKIGIMDLFTTFGSESGIIPLLPSSALRQMIGLSKPEYTDIKEKREDLNKILTEITPEWAKGWKEHFKDIENWFAKSKNQSSQIEKNASESAKPMLILNEKEEKKGFEIIENLLSTEIEPKFLSILTYGEFKKSKQIMLAIVERVPLKDQTKASWSKRQTFLVPPGYKIVKLYSGIDGF